MNLKPLGMNKTEVELEPDHRILFSYRTPVAETYLSPEGMIYRITEKKWSRTTSKHISSWLPVDQAEEMPQEYFDNLLSGVK